MRRIVERRFGVEPICRTLGVSASAYYQRRKGERSQRAVDDERLLHRIREMHAANFYAYGYRRRWKALLRAGERAASRGARGRLPVGGPTQTPLSPGSRTGLSLIGQSS